MYYRKEKSRSDDRKYIISSGFVLNKVTILPNGYLSTGVKNNGCTVYQAINGKNIMGTARPGNNSGNLISRGRETDIGIITAAKERMENNFKKSINH